jgi:N-methylhydantoinase A/oxoprolinase/acetone carboxylase beta subunit
MRFLSPKLRVFSETDVKEICTAFYQKYIQRYGELSALPERGIAVESFYLAGIVLLPKPALPIGEMGGENASRAVKGRRKAWWQDLSQPKESPIYDASLLVPGNVIHGPAIVEATDTTVVIPPGTRYSIDRYFSAIFETE